MSAAADAPPPYVAEHPPTKKPVPSAPRAGPLAEPWVAELDQRLADEVNARIDDMIRQFKGDLRTHGTIVLTDGSILRRGLTGWSGSPIGKEISASRLVSEDRQAELKALIELRIHNPRWVVWRSKQDMVDPALQRLPQM
jgi:hypothetical protein